METKKFYFDLQKCIEIAQNTVLPSEQSVMLKYIELFYCGGEIVPINKCRSAVDASNILNYLHNFSEVNTIIDSEIIIKGVLNKDFEYINSDPYQTAGGYITGVCLKDSEITCKIGYSYTGFKIEIYCNVNILTDHYNNNFFGVSSGNGTKKYEVGQRVENLKIDTVTNLYIFSKYDLITVTEIDIKKIKDFIFSQID